MKTYTSNHIVFFSPTHTSAKIARAIGESIGMGRRIEIDLTTDENSSPIEIKDSITIIAVPVYAGRVAPIALQRLRRLKGNNAPAILVAVYGNRDYEDALVELRDETIQLGFTPLAAGAFIGEHSYSRPNMPIAEGRPDVTDLQIAEQFGKDCLTKLEKDETLSDFYLKGNIPYRFVGPSTPAAPVCTEECFACGECIEVCPTHAIALSDEGKIETEITKCMKCQSTRCKKLQRVFYCNLSKKVQSGAPSGDENSSGPPPVRRAKTPQWGVFRARESPRWCTRKSRNECCGFFIAPFPSGRTRTSRKRSCSSRGDWSLKMVAGL